MKYLIIQYDYATAIATHIPPTSIAPSC